MIVIDTNVFVGACLGNGASARLIAACLRGDHRVAMGAALLAEYEDVIGRTALFESARLAEAERSELLDIFLSTCSWTRTYFLWRPNLRDERDNHVLELAIAAGATHVVTWNLRDFKHGELKFPSIAFCNPKQFLKEPL